MRRVRVGVGLVLVLALVACGLAASDAMSAAAVRMFPSAARPFVATPVASFDQPWAMCFLPDGRMLVTEKAGRLLLASRDGRPALAVAGVPAVAYGGQGGLGDIVLHPQFRDNAFIYLSYAEADDQGRRGAAVARARLRLDVAPEPRLDDLQVIWRQTPKVSGQGHYGHRLIFSPDGMLFISSGDRQQMAPAQDLQQNLGKIIRLRDDGAVPADNPFADKAGVAGEVWSSGHRNPLGVAFDAQGRLWSHEMGPQGGDELNLIRRGANYGWPLVSNGSHYDGRDIPDHGTRPEFSAPKVFWTPVIAPAGLIIYTGMRFPQWHGSGFIGGLRSQALIRIAFDGEAAREAERWDMGHRIREVEQGPDGAIWLLEDGQPGRLLRLTPTSTATTRPAP